MVLCGQCHHLCTVGAITEAAQRAHKSRPKNIVDNLVRGQLFVNVGELAVNLGGGRAVETPRLLVLSDETVLGAKLDKQDGRVLLSANIHDRSGQVIAKLEDNEWTMEPGNVWDFEVFPLHAKVRLNPRDIVFAIDVRNDEIDVQGRWFHQGQNIDFTPTMARIGSHRLFGFNVSHCETMIAFG